MGPALLLWVLVGCHHAAPDTEDPPDSEPAAPSRIVAFGDVHGDLEATRSALQLAGVIDSEDHWAGGETILVQTGDQLDRGDDEKAILDLFESLREEAQAAGGAFHVLVGNHEAMNVDLDFRYVTDGGFEDFADTEYDADDAELQALPEEWRGRAAAFRPGGPYAEILAEHPVIAQVEANVFVHGGVLSSHVEYGIDTINEEVAAWMRGQAEEPDYIDSSDAPVWTREYSDDPDEGSGDDSEEGTCDQLQEVLDALGADRMVVGHTVQSGGIAAYCEERVWCIDVGMAEHYGGDPAVLEIVGDETTIIQ